MKISAFLPQFKGPTLLIVAGKQHASLYVANQDVVNEIGTIKVNKSSYTDREGRFAKIAGGRMMQSGSMNEMHEDEETIRSMSKQMAERADLAAQEHGITSVFMFVPTYLANRMEASLPVDLQKKIEYVFYGNFQHQHPYVLLSKIQELRREEKDESNVDQIKSEALGILKNTASFPH
jgi:hypothetical protein